LVFSSDSKQKTINQSIFGIFLSFDSCPVPGFIHELPLITATALLLLSHGASGQQPPLSLWPVPKYYILNGIENAICWHCLLLKRFTWIRLGRLLTSISCYSY
jgi:hypothetical protein